MKQSIKLILGGAVFCLPMLFTSCGNIDNPLEEIIASNAPTASEVSALADALDEGSNVTFNFKCIASSIEFPIQVEFSKQNGKFNLTSADYQIPAGLPEDIATTVTAILDNVKNHDNGLELTYNETTNQLKASIMYISNANPPVSTPLLTVVFDISNNKYTQYLYIISDLFFFVWDGVSVNGVDKFSQLGTDYPKKALFYEGYHDDAPLRFYVFYQEGETWKDLNERYINIAGSALLKDVDEAEGASFAISDDSDIFYNEVNADHTNYGAKIGYKSSTPLTHGYFIDDDNDPYGGQ